MRQRFLLVVSMFLVACGGDAVPEKIQAKVDQLVRAEFSSTRNVASPVEIKVTKVDNISPADYYAGELKSQNAQFDKFIGLQSQSHTKTDLTENMAAHNRIVAYLEHARDTASKRNSLYAVSYQVQVATAKQSKSVDRVMFLDSLMNKLEPDYTFLKQ